jgi:hypothetical protein
MSHFHSGFRECIIVSSKGLIEIIFHGRGGQGAVTAANLLVAAALTWCTSTSICTNFRRRNTSEK